MASLCARGIITPALALMQPFSAKSIRRNKFLLGTHLLHLGRERQLWTIVIVGVWEGGRGGGGGKWYAPPNFSQCNRAGFRLVGPPGQVKLWGPQIIICNVYVNLYAIKHEFRSKGWRENLGMRGPGQRPPPRKSSVYCCSVISIFFGGKPD